MTSTASTSSSSPTSRPSASREARDPERREGPRDERCVADFERALHRRSQSQERGGGQSFGEREAEQPPSDAGLPPPPMTLPFALALAQVQPPAAIEAPPPTRGLVEPPPAALRAELSQPAGPAGTDAARAFEISLKEPLGAALTLHAVAPTAGTQWTLSIGAHGLNQQDLRRNLGRLEQRLRAKGVTHEPLELHQSGADAAASTESAEDLP
jgi:hypothetical protein